MSSQNYNQSSEILLKAVSWLCKPLIHLLISNGITFPQFRDLLKGLYVNVAEQDLLCKGKDVSDSRLFILTGVHRKDIKRLRQMSADENLQISQTSSLGGAIVARWLDVADFLDDKGEPRCLSRNSKNDLAGFEQLVTEVSKDVRPRAILDEWLHSGIVSINEQDEICLNQKAFVPSKNFNDQSFYLARNVHDHIAACENNMLSTNPPMLERSVYYSSLTPESVQKLKNMTQKEGADLLQKINHEAMQLQKQDETKEEANQRMRFGCYWYDEEQNKSFIKDKESNS